MQTVTYTISKEELEVEIELLSLLTEFKQTVNIVQDESSG